MLDIKLKTVLILSVLLAACSNNESEPASAVTIDTSVASDAELENSKVVQAVELVSEQVAEPEVEVAPELAPEPEVELASEIVAEAEVIAEPELEAVQQATDDAKPYQITDGKLSDNLMEGWRTYNGGGCGACHGKGGIGAVGPNLADSLKSKISKEQFYELVKNGKPGTMMRPNFTNKRVMDNLDNLYAYILARSDGVLGPENLIKFPMGKKAE